MVWRDLGAITPTEQMWLPLAVTHATGSIFRITFSAPISLEKIQSHAWISYRCVGGPTALPPSLAFRAYPDARGRLAEIPYPQELIALGYTSRIFEVRRNRVDSVNWRIQIEELI